MASADKVIQLSVKINAETGALEVLGAKFKGAAGAAKEAEGAFSGLTKEAHKLLLEYASFETVKGVVEFFADSVREAEENNESLRKLSFAVRAAGQAWGAEKEKILDWTDAIRESTRFSDNEALTSLEKLTRATGNVQQAMVASKLAMGISVSSTMDLSSATRLVSDLINGQTRAVALANKEFGALVSGATNASQVMEVLYKNFYNAAQNENDFTSSSAKLKNAVGELKEGLGNSLIPILTQTVEWVNTLIPKFDQAAVRTAGWGRLLKAAVTGQGYEIIQAWREMGAQLDQIEKDDIARRARRHDREASGPPEVHHNVEEARVANEKLLEMERDLDQKIAAIGDNTFEKKRAIIAAEIKAERDKVAQIVQTGGNGAAALRKIGEQEKAAYAQLSRDEVRIRQAAALEIGDLALQTLAILNEMGDSHNRSEVMRAKAILALEKSIAIARAIAEAQKGGPLAAGIAAAQIALIGAQFAQQSQAIDRAASDGAQASSQSQPRSLTQPSTTQDGGQVTAPAAFVNGRAPQQSAQGGGGTVTLNININLQLPSVDGAAVASLTQKLTEAVRTGAADALTAAFGQRIIEQIRGAGQIPFIRG